MDIKHICIPRSSFVHVDKRVREKSLGNIVDEIFFKILKKKVYGYKR